MLLPHPKEGLQQNEEAHTDNAKTKFVHNGKTLTGISGKGKLTDKKIKVMQGHYGAAIRNNPGDVSAMKKAVWAIFHQGSGHHEDCPDWCPMTKNNDLDRANKNMLPKYIMDVIRPVF